MTRILSSLALWLLMACPVWAQGNNYRSWSVFEDFIGAGTLSTSATADSRWIITDTSAAGTPTYERIDFSETTGAYPGGAARLKFSNTNEAQNLCLSFGDKLALDWDKISGVEFRLRFVAETGSAKDAATTLSFGICSDRNDDLTATTAHAMFRLDAASTSMALTLDTDDGTTDTSDVATTITMADNTWYRFRLQVSGNTSDMKFFGIAAQTNPSVTPTPLAVSQTFDTDQYHGGCQPFVQIQKTADTNTDAVEVDYVDVWGNR